MSYRDYKQFEKDRSMRMFLPQEIKSFTGSLTTRREKKEEISIEKKKINHHLRKGKEEKCKEK